MAPIRKEFNMEKASLKDKLATLSEEQLARLTECKDAAHIIKKLREATSEEFSLAELKEFAGDFKAAEPAMSDEDLKQAAGGQTGYAADYAAKWHVSAAAHAKSIPLPPGLARVLDILSASIAPEIKA